MGKYLVEEIEQTNNALLAQSLLCSPLRGMDLERFSVFVFFWYLGYYKVDLNNSANIFKTHHTSLDDRDRKVTEK